MKKINVYMFVDALGWKIAETHKFMSDTLAFRSRAQMQFGYSSAAVPTILSGEPPTKHGHLCFFYYDPKNSPFKNFKYLKYCFGAGLHPKCLFNRNRVRRQISKFFARRHGYTGYFNLYSVPFDNLAYFDYCEKYDIFAQHGLPVPNLCDVLTASGLKFHISNWRNTEAQNIADAKSAIAGGADFVFVYTADFDGFLHDHPSDSALIAERLKGYTQKASEILAALKATGREYKFTIISDHGMSPLSGTVDLSAKIKALGLKFGRDYAAFYDSTMARFWYIEPSARAKIRDALSGAECRGAFLTDDEKKKYGIDFADNKFGDDIFLTSDGVQIVPCDLGRRALNGMHGFSPEAEDSYASFLSTEAPAYQPQKVADYFGLMKRDIEASAQGAAK